ncbi:hypothetical protein AWM70_02040 [Paenibacillus yonginensis]|uniref:Aminotransferase class I/classII large domain-containing protein n=1 Tax=Paenibacillus yonginensis TaxID=1462996 RepID=A0A1B1MWF4_9BACL|nr:hypothetical protein AWM70_02040 [Paenibacillus yonginensis]
MVFLNPNFQNPTGTVTSAERRKQLLDVASELRLPIVEDDPFSLTAYNGEAPLPLEAADVNGSVLNIGSFSKIAASGLRVGWMVAPHAIVERLADARQQMDFGLIVIPQQVAASVPKIAAIRATSKPAADAADLQTRCLVTWSFIQSPKADSIYGASWCPMPKPKRMKSAGAAPALPKHCAD